MSARESSALRGRVRRYSLLKRHARHSRASFSSYYERHHGPLAAAQAGFRKYTTRYLQNHILELPDGAEARFDGVSITTQVLRADYTQGFFGEPDYQNVKEDEAYLFDMAATVSLLGEETAVLDGEPSAFKALLLAPWHELNSQRYAGLVRIVANRLAVETASALGFGRSRFTDDLLAELWFDSAESRERAWRITQSAEAKSAGALMPVREVLIFAPEKPWRV